MSYRLSAVVWEPERLAPGVGLLPGWGGPACLKAVGLAPSCWVGRSTYEGLGRSFPQLPAASRCFQMLPANDVEQALAGSGIIPPCASSCQPLPASASFRWKTVVGHIET